MKNKNIHKTYLAFCLMLASFLSSCDLGSEKDSRGIYAESSRSIEITNGRLERLNKKMIDDFKNQLITRSIQVQPYFDKAMIVDVESSELFDYFTQLKDSLSKGASYKYFLKAHYATATKKIKHYKSKILPFVDNKADVPLDYLSYSFPDIKNPEMGVLYLTNLQNEVLNSRYDMLDYLINAIGRNFIDEIPVPMVHSEKNVLMQGEEYNAEIYLGWYDHKQNVDVEISGQKLKVRDGKAEYKTIATDTGEKSLEGSIIITGPDGEKQRYPFKSNYLVIEKKSK